MASNRPWCVVAKLGPGSVEGSGCTASPNTSKDNTSTNPIPTGQSPNVFPACVHGERMFRNASNIVVNGGSFTNIDNATNIDAVSTTLWQHVASGAIFDSAERYPPGKCHPGTRKTVIEQIIAWINDPNPARHVFWLHGPAGSGKSALAHSICEFLREYHPTLYGGSFFFARGHSDRGKGIKLFTTLSYQLALQFPAIRAEINEALSRDPSLPTKSMDVQLLFLVINPLLRCGTLNGSHTPTIIIDGLDECDEEDGVDTQRTIISLLASSIIQHRIPLRFMVACRPEYWIREAFDSAPLPALTLSLSLRDDEDADKDIRTYLVDEFERIRVQHRRAMGLVVAPWPPTNVIDRFVYEASGQYIYASTILKFVGNSSKFNNPQEQLRIILSFGPDRAPAFSELDRLYSTIVSAYPRTEPMKFVLGGLLVNANLTTIEIVFGIDPIEIGLVLEALDSLIDISTPSPLAEYELLLEPIFGSLLHGEDQISFSHLTFREFLVEKTRSGPFHVDPFRVQETIAHKFFSMIHRNLDHNYETEPHLSSKLDLTVYRRMMSGMIFHAVPYCEVGVLLQLISKLTRRLRLLNPHRPMNHPACFIQDMEWIESMLSETEDHYKSALPLDLEQSSTVNPYDPRSRKLLIAISELRETVSGARKQGIRLLSLCEGYRITPTLVYMNVFSSGYGAPLAKLFTIPGTTVAETLSSLRQHRHIIKLYELEDQHWFMYLLNLDINSVDGVDEGWLSRAEWRAQRTALTYQCLMSFMNNGDNDWEHSIDGSVDMIYTVIGDFFDNGDMSDIRTPEYFKNEHNLSLLALMADSTAWSNLLRIRPNLLAEQSSVIRPALGWLDRQLTNSQTIKLMQNYDKDLPQKLQAISKGLSERFNVSAGDDSSL